MSKDTENHILEKGKALIQTDGYHGVGLKRILDRAEVPKGSFYHYFKSKEDFGLRVLDAYSQETNAFLQEHLEDKSKNPKARILHLLETMKEIYEAQQYDLGCLLGNCSLELANQKDSFATKISEHFQLWQQKFEKIIAEGQTTGDINDQMPARAYADFIINSWEGALVRTKAVKNNQPMNLLIEVLDKLL